MGIIFGIDLDGMLGASLSAASLIIIIYAGIIVFRKTPLSSILQQSSFITIIGILIGLIIAYTESKGREISFSRSFFNYVVTPPIIFNTGYFLKRDFFFENIVEILMLAFVGTLLNIFMIGGLFYALRPLFDLEYSIEDIMLYAACLSSVAPTSVLEVFNAEHINDTLYIIVFGESTLNSVISLTIFEVFQALSIEDQNATLIPLGIAKFLVFSVGGILVGVVLSVALMWGLKFATYVPYLSVTAPYIIGFSAYALANALYFSGPIAIIVSGMQLSRYNELNMHPQVRDAFQIFARGIALVASSVLFILFGVVAYNIINLASKTETFDWSLVAATLIACIVTRFLWIFGLIPLINEYRVKHKALEHRKAIIPLSDRFILAYAGVRGAISILLLIDIPDTIPTASKNALLSAAVIEIWFSMFIQGGTIRFWVRLLHEKKYKGIKVPRLRHWLRDRNRNKDGDDAYHRLYYNRGVLTEQEQAMEDARRILTQPLELLVDGAHSISGVARLSATRFYEVVGLVDNTFYSSIVRPKKPTAGDRGKGI